MLLKRLAELIWLFLFLFLLVSILPAVFMVTGNEKIAKSIHSVYRVSCHQRVERSIFLFGIEGPVNFYTLEELKFLGVIPERNPKVPPAHAEDIFGYPYLGDEVVGYKTALCIRDLSIYSAILITGAIYILWAKKNKKVVKFDWKLILILMIPMMVDGTFQLIAEIFRWEWVPDAYFANNLKRIITGAMFGIGFALLIFPNLMESTELWYNDKENKGPAPDKNMKKVEKDERKT